MSYQHMYGLVRRSAQITPSPVGECSKYLSAVRVCLPECLFICLFCLLYPCFFVFDSRDFQIKCSIRLNFYLNIKCYYVYQPTFCTTTSMTENWKEGNVTQLGWSLHALSVDKIIKTAHRVK